MLVIFLVGIAEASLAKADQYQAWHAVCLDADADTVDVQIAKFEQSLAANPKDALCKVYLGSAYALRAKAGRWGPTKLRYLNRAKKLMNEAVNEDPTNPRVYMVRGIACYKIPKKFGYRKVSLADFEKVIPLAKSGGGGKEALRVNERQVILYYAYLAKSEEKVMGAADLKAACHRLDPQSKYGKATK